MEEPTTRPMSLEGPYANERARLNGTFTDLDRAWRKQWLKDQHLSPNEPRPIPPSMNPIRRAYRFPLDWVFAKLEPHLVILIFMFQAYHFFCKCNLNVICFGYVSFRVNTLHLPVTGLANTCS